MRLSWLFLALTFATALAYAQHVALAEFLYWRFPWFDTFMHFLGGLTIGTLVIGVFRDLRPKLFLGALVAVAVGWELFELVINAEREANFAFDTSLDILMDALGALLAYVVARLTVWRSV